MSVASQRSNEHQHRRILFFLLLLARDSETGRTTHRPLPNIVIAHGHDERLSLVRNDPHDHLKDLSANAHRNFIDRRKPREVLVDLMLP